MEGHHPLLLIFRLTGHRLPAGGYGRRNLHLALIFVIMALGVYQCIWFLYNNVLRCGINLFMLRFTIWTSKGIIVQLFLLHLQFGGRPKFEYFLLLISKKAEDARLRHKIRCILWLSIGIYLLLISTGFVYFLLRMQKIVDSGHHFNYGSMSQILVRNSMWWVSMWLVIMALAFYNASVCSVLVELEQFKQQSELILCAENNCGEESRSVDHFNSYLALLKKVESLNSVFQVYLFLMLGSNIPITISTLLRLFTSPIKGLLQYMFILPEALFCLFELAALTGCAAKVHMLVRGIAKTFFLNSRVEMPVTSSQLGMGEGIRHQLRALIIHLSSQSNFGITLWGFGTITKSLIITVLSVVVTYLTVILQLIPPPIDELTDQQQQYPHLIGELNGNGSEWRNETKVLC